jgi:type I restriction enzyme S subunit
MSSKSCNSPSWQTEQLGRLAQVKGGKRLPNGEKLLSEATPFPYIRVCDFNAYSVDLTDIHYLAPAIQKKISRYIIAKEDVFISIAGTIGVVGTIPESLDGANLTENAARVVLQPDGCLDRDFLKYCLASPTIQNDIASRRSKNAQPKLALAQIKALEIPLPPLPEQKKIAHILSTVQRAIEAQERIIQTTTELKKALKHRLFTEGLRGEPQEETEIGPIPESWKQTTLAKLCEKPDGALQTGPFGSQLHKNEYQEEGIAVVNPTHLAGNRINHENVPRVSQSVAQRLGKHRLRKFDILFARRGEIGRQGLVSDAEETWLCGTGCFLVRASKPFVDNRFLALYFATDRIVKWLYSHAAGAIMPNLNNAVMQRLPVFYPDLETQSTIIETFTTIDQKLSAAVQRQTALQGLFRTLLHELMTAKTRVYTINLPSFT